MNILQWWPFNRKPKRTPEQQADLEYAVVLRLATAYAIQCGITVNESMTRISNGDGRFNCWFNDLPQDSGLKKALMDL